VIMSPTVRLQRVVLAETRRTADEGLLVLGWHGPIPWLGSMRASRAGPEVRERQAGDRADVGV